jgi:hypothetical protein
MFTAGCKRGIFWELRPMVWALAGVADFSNREVRKERTLA